MNPETLYFVAVGLCGFGVAVLGVAVVGLHRKVRALETKLRTPPRPFIKGVRGGRIIMDEATGTGAHLLDEITKLNQRLPKGRGLL